MKIELLWFEGCPNHHAAREIAEEVLAENGLPDEIISVEVPDLETGESVRFPGSPTIRIDGIDIDPGYEDTGDYTPRCRVFMTDAGLKGVPERRWVSDAINAAKRVNAS